MAKQVELQFQTAGARGPGIRRVRLDVIRKNRLFSDLFG